MQAAKLVVQTTKMFDYVTGNDIIAKYGVPILQKGGRLITNATGGLGGTNNHVKQQSIFKINHSFQSRKENR
eukprot:UN17457